MSQQITGVVRKVYEKQIPGKATMYSLIVGDSMDKGGDGEFYGTGSTKPDVNEGDRVSFTASQNGRFWNADVKSIKVEEAGAAKPAPAAQRKGAYSGGGNWGPEKEASIIMQSSSKTAAELVSAFATAGGKIKDMDQLMSLHQEVTLTIYNRCSRPLEFIKAVATPAEVQEAAATDGDKVVVSDF